MCCDIVKHIKTYEVNFFSGTIQFKIREGNLPSSLVPTAGERSTTSSTSITRHRVSVRFFIHLNILCFMLEKKIIKIIWVNFSHSRTWFTIKICFNARISPGWCFARRVENEKRSEIIKNFLERVVKSHLNAYMRERQTRVGVLGRGKRIFETFESGVEKMK